MTVMNEFVRLFTLGKESNLIDGLRICKINGLIFGNTLIEQCAQINKYIGTNARKVSTSIKKRLKEVRRSYGMSTECWELHPNVVHCL